MPTENINGYVIEYATGDDYATLGSVEAATKLFSLAGAGHVTAEQLLALIALGSGDTASRPAASGVKGRVYNNTETGNVEFSDGSSWLTLGGGSGVSALSALNDVDSSAKADGRVLAWDAGVGKNVYVDPPAGGGGVTQLSALNDVDSSAKADGRVLAWDAGVGKNVYVDPPAGAGGGVGDLVADYVASADAVSGVLSIDLSAGKNVVTVLVDAPVALALAGATGKNQQLVVFLLGTGASTSVNLRRIRYDVADVEVTSGKRPIAIDLNDGFAAPYLTVGEEQAYALPAANFSLTPGDGTLTANYTPVAGLERQFRIAGGLWQAASDGTHTFSGLTNGTSYPVDSRVVDAYGNAGSLSSQSGTPSAEAAFTPTSLSGLVAWWDASALGLSNGAAVTALSDLSGNGYDLASSGGNPVYRPAQQNGLGAMEFDGVNSNLQRSPIMALDGSNVTIFMVMRAGSSTNYAAYLNQANTNADGYAGIGVAATATAGQVTAHPFGNNNRPTKTIGTSNYRVVVAYHDGSVKGIYTDADATPATSASPNQAATVAYQRFALGRLAYASTYAAGFIGEVVIYGRYLSSAERGQVMSYLTAKWGL